MRMTELVLKVVTGEELGAGRRVFLGLFHPNTVGARDRCRGPPRALLAYIYLVILNCGSPCRLGKSRFRVVQAANLWALFFYQLFGLRPRFPYLYPSDYRICCVGSVCAFDAFKLSTSHI